MSDIKAFGERVKKLGMKFNAMVLIKAGEDITEYAQNYDLPAIETALKTISKVVEELEKEKQMDKGRKDIVFVIDDTSENIKILGNILEQKGYEPMVFLSAKAALKSIKQVMPEIILLDIMMPEMDGYEMCRILKAENRTKDIPVIFLTGRTDTDSIVKGFDMGAADYVKKPFQVAELLSRIKTHIGFKKAKEEVSTLSGLLPICASCKKVRDDKGYWNQIENYIEKHSTAQFSHSMCPECSDKFYGDQDWYIKMKKKQTSAKNQT